MATAVRPRVTAESPRSEILEELERANYAAKNFPHYAAAYEIAHLRINELLDWLVGR